MKVHSTLVTLVLLGIAPVSRGATIAGFYLLGSAPQVRVEYSSDYGPSIYGSLLSPSSGPWTGAHTRMVSGNGPGAATSKVTIDCPAPETTPGNPTIVRFEFVVGNADPGAGLQAGGSAYPVRLIPTPASPNRYYRVECRYTYELVSGVPGYGLIYLNVSGNAHPIRPINSNYAVGTVTQVFTGTSGSMPIDTYVEATLYQGQLNPGAGKLTVEFRIWVDSAPVPAPCPGDADGDRSIGFGDITGVLTNWGVSYAPGTGPGDTNFDGVVNFADITQVLTSFGATCP